MQRRTFLIGTAGTAVGSSALVGSGAFTTGSLENRETNIDVVHDSVGAIGLIDTMPNSGMVDYSDNPGKLEIDFTAGGGAGANVGGMFKLGYRPGDSELERKDFDAFDPEIGSNAPIDASDLAGLTWYNGAFAIWNRGTQTYDLTFEYDPDHDPGDSELRIWLFNGDDEPYNYPDGTQGGDTPALVIDDGDAKSFTVDGSHPDARRFNPNKRVFVAMEVHTQDGSTADDLSGTITIRAGPASENGDSEPEPEPDPDPAAESELSNLDINGQGPEAMLSIPPGNPAVDISADVTNVGTGTGTFDVDLEVINRNDNQAASASLSTGEIDPSETETVTFEDVQGGFNSGVSPYTVRVTTDDDEINGMFGVSNPDMPH